LEGRIFEDVVPSDRYRHPLPMKGAASEAATPWGLLGIGREIR
jgi:hypothetical protein